MIVPTNNIANKSKPKENSNVTVNYSTNLTHPELAPQSPLQNPILERTKSLNPSQQITVIGRGTDPSVITNHLTNINPSEKTQSTNTQTKTTSTTQTTNLTPQEVLGPFVKAFNGTNLNQILQITNGLTLPLSLIHI